MHAGHSEMNGSIVERRSLAESDLRGIGVLRSFRSPFMGGERQESNFRAIRDRPNLRSNGTSPRPYRDGKQQLGIAV
jgi:hypothetical protein